MVVERSISTVVGERSELGEGVSGNMTLTVKFISLFMRNYIIFGTARI